MHILIVHPDPAIYREILPLLSSHGATGAFARSMAAARDQVEAVHPDLVVIGSTVLPDDGSDPLLSTLSRGPGRSVLYITALEAEEFGTSVEKEHLDRLLTSVSGFRPRRRLRYRQVGGLRLDVARQRVSLGDQWVPLPRLQFRILRHLVEHRDQLITHAELTKAVWGYSADPGEARDLLKVHMRQIRRRAGPGILPYIQTVRGEGYVLVDPSEES